MAFFGGGDKINVVAELRAKAGSEEVVRALLTSLVAPSRKESGCKQYHLHEDTRQPGLFFTYEEWSSEEALEKHLEGAKPMLAQAESLIEGTTRISVLKLLV